VKIGFKANNTAFVQRQNILQIRDVILSMRERYFPSSMLHHLKAIVYKRFRIKCNPNYNWSHQYCCLICFFHSANDYIVLTPAELLHNWQQQQPSNQYDIVSNVARKTWRIHYKAEQLRNSFVSHTVSLLFGFHSEIIYLAYRHKDVSIVKQRSNTSTCSANE
jgi:hypothetical protein